MAIEAAVESESTDIAALWSEALKSYYITTGQDLRTLPRFTSVNDVMNDAQLKNDLFDNFRHDKGKVDKLRSAVSRNSDLVMKGAQYIAQAAIPAFPPAAAILTAFTYVMKACKDVSADYDKILSFFDEMNNFLERVSIIESRMPTVPAYKVFLTRVFSSMMNLLAVATRAIKKGRFKKWFKTLLEGGGDDELSGGYSAMETALKRLESATNFATLGNTEEIKKDTKTVIVTTERVDITTQRIDLATQDISSSVKEGFLQVTELQAQLAENFAKMMEDQKKEAAKKAAPAAHSKDPGARKHAAFALVSRNFLTPPLLKEQVRDIQSSFVHGTAAWTFEEQAYLDWSTNKLSNLFVVAGPGMGKSNIVFSIVERLQETAAYSSRTSVAYFYFKNEHSDLRSMSKAINSIILQLAEQDTVYCEQVAAEITKLKFTSVNTADWQGLWDKFIVHKFSHNSDSLAYLVIDGLDEALPQERKDFLDLLSKLQVGKTKIQVLITLRPDPEYIFDNFKSNGGEILVTKEKISADFPHLINARMNRFNGLPKLARFRKQVKKKISKELQEKADGMLYIELMLRRYNIIGREGAVLKDIADFKPTDLSSLYGMMLAEVQERRSAEQYQSLKKLFAWLSFSERPLTLSEASALVTLTGQDSSLDIEEELEGKSSRILELTAPLGREEDNDGSDNENEKDDEYTGDDGSFPLRFQERSLREYFRAMSTDDEGLRTSPSSAHLTIFENIASVLSGKSATSEKLGDYAVKYWLSHFQNINPASHSGNDVVRLFDSLALIFNNAFAATILIEKHSLVYTWFGDATQGIPNAWFFVRLKEWLERVPENSEAMSDTTRAWVEATKTSPLKVVAPFVHGHIESWFSAPLSNAMNRAMLFAIHALCYTDLLPTPTPKEKLNPPAELIISLAGLYGHSSIPGKNSRITGLLLTRYKHWDIAIEWFRMNIDNLDVFTVLRRFYNYVEIAKAQMYLAENNHEDDDDQPYVLAALESINTALSIDFTPEEESHKINYPIQVREVLLRRALCERRLHKPQDAIKSYEAAKLALPTQTMAGKDLYKWTNLLTDAELLETLSGWTLWDRMSWLTYFVYDDDRDEFEPEDTILMGPNDRFQRAAKEQGKLQFMIETYEQIIAYKVASKQAGYPRLQLAVAYAHVIGDVEKAKAVLYEILDSDSCLNPFGGDDYDTVLDTRTEVSGLIYGQFCASSDPVQKTALLAEFKKLHERRLARNLSYFGVYSSSAAVCAAKMTRKVGTAAEFQDIVQRIFDSCMEGLNDAEGWNDCGSLRLLAKILILLGLNREAAICLSAQFSIIDPAVVHRECSDSESDSDSDSESESGEGSGDDEDKGEDEDGSQAEKESKGKADGDEKEFDEDIAPQTWVGCDGQCAKPEHGDWKDGPIYSCLVCVDSDLCQSCYDIRKARNRGEPGTEYWREYCGKNHSYIKAPVDEWKGIKGGVMTIGEEKVVFMDWLKEVKEVKWKAAWTKFWSNDESEVDILI